MNTLSAGKQAGDTIRVADLPIATTEGIHLKTNPEETVVQVTEVHNEVPEDEETETEEEQKTDENKKNRPSQM